MGGMDGMEWKGGPVRRGVVADPRKLGEADVRQHEVTHLCYRNWCWACVQGRGKKKPHRARQGEQGLQENHFYYMFFGDRADAGGARICIVATKDGTMLVLATMLPSESRDRFASDHVMVILSETGRLHVDVVVRSDQEAAIKHSVEEVGERRASDGGGKWIVEHSPVMSSASHGVVVRVMQSGQG